MKSYLKLIISLGIPLLVGAISGYFTAGSVNGWFTTIQKPSFNPPNWIFAPVWTTLYILMGLAFYIVWKANVETKLKKIAILFYSIQLVLNFLWSFIFFGCQQPGWALADIILLLAMILLTTLWFERISVSAAWLMAPYICWVSFATVLNYHIWKLN
ncbi:MAG: TspO/MBR family protein [Ferruginibacter sp.]